MKPLTALTLSSDGMGARRKTQCQRKKSQPIIARLVFMLFQKTPIKIFLGSLAGLKLEAVISSLTEQKGKPLVRPVRLEEV